MFRLLPTILLALVLFFPSPCAAAEESDSGDSGRQETPDVMDNAKNLTRRQGALSEETIRAAQSGEAKAKPPVGATPGGMAAPTKPSKGGKAIYGDIVVHK